MDFTSLRTLCEVVRRGNYSHAADALGYAQSSVTIQIKKMETFYGVTLFERYGRLMKPTQAGEVLYDYAMRMLQLHEEAICQVSKQEMGNLTLGSIETLATYFLPPILQEFRRAYNKVTVTIQPSIEDNIAASVRKGEIDLGLMLEEPWQDDELEVIPLQEEPFVIITAPDAPALAVNTLQVSDLQDAHFLLTEPGCTYRESLIRRLRGKSLSYQVIAEFGSVEAIKRCVHHGIGISFLPEIAVRQEVLSGFLRAYPFSPPQPLVTQLVYRKAGWKSQPLQHLLTLIQSEARHSSEMMSIPRR